MNIGKNTETNKEVKIDLSNLVDTRLLVQANSGGGKSWLLRRLLEKSHGKIQQIVIDLEGEFASLREKYDYMLVGQDGEMHATVQSSEYLARKLLELNVSTIIDLSELKHHERILFVKKFLSALVDSPKKLWHPVLIVVDEAHQFCPQTGKCESSNAVIDLMTRGRKRGQCGCLATQRISKLNKDAVAEANNKLIGRTGLDIDMKRAGEELGFTSKEQFRSLRGLDAGEFFAFGPSFDKGIAKVMVGDVATTHPKSGGRQLIQPTKTPENIKKLLADVIDIPKEAEEELRTKEDMQKKIIELKREVRTVKHSAPKPKVDENMLRVAQDRGFKVGMKHQEEYIVYLERIHKNIKKLLTLQCINMRDNLAKLEKNIVAAEDVSKPKDITESVSKPIVLPEIVRKPVPITPQPIQPIPTTQEFGEESVPLKSGAMRILGWLTGMYPEPMTKQRVATLSGFSMKGGTFGAYISQLKKNRWITGDGELVATEEGIQNSTEHPELPTKEALISLWAGKFKAGVGKMLRKVCEVYPSPISKEELGEETGFEHTGGTFGAYLSVLRRNNLIEVNNGDVIASKEFFE